MVSEVQPQPGDKVHVVVHRPTEFDATVTSLEPGWIHLVDEEGAERSLELPGAYPSEITILERADDPSRDPVGTVRQGQSPTDGVTFLPIVKMDSNKWHVVGNPGQEYDDSYVARYTVTGAVPGTPAAQAQREKDDTDREREFKALAKAEQSQACGDYSPKGELGGTYYTVCLHCGFGPGAHGEVVGP